MEKKKDKYVEPVDFFPKELRKKFKVGEFNDQTNGAAENKANAEKQKTNKAIRDYVNGKK